MKKTTGLTIIAITATVIFLVVRNAIDRHAYNLSRNAIDYVLLYESGFLTDGYDTPLKVYTTPEVVYVISAGEDKIFDTKDDIRKARIKKLPPKEVVTDEK